MTPLEEWIYYGPIVLYNVGLACIFYWMAMEWQRRQENCFFFLALSCGLGLLMVVMDHVAGRQQLNEKEYYGYICSRQFVLLLDAILFPYGIWRLVKYLKKAIVPTASLEGLDSTNKAQ